jgi:CBS domain-containing protein
MPVELLVKDIMSTPPITCEENTAVGEVIKRMIKHNVGSIVVTKNKKPIGIITERDIVRKYLSKRFNLLTKAKHIMSQPVRVIKEETKVTDAARLMADYGIRKLPVVNSSGEVVGIITEGDIVRHANSILDILKEIKETGFNPEEKI